MRTLATRQPRLFRKLATFAFALTILSLAASDASAQSGGGIHGYFERFYGQNFYDGQRTGFLAHRGPQTQYHGGDYSPPMMYDRQYGDRFGYRADPGFAPLHRTLGIRSAWDYAPRRVPQLPPEPNY
jgi:hypothetical protein